MESLEQDSYVIVGDERIGYELIYMMDDYDPEEKYQLISYLTENKCQIKPLVWCSKYDKSVTTDVQPMIYDVYNCVIRARGALHMLIHAIHQYTKRLSSIKFLEDCFKIGNPEGSRKCVDEERENTPIKYGELANIILASLSHPRWQGT